MTAPRREAPSLAELLRHVAEMPPAFQAEPEGFPGGRVRVRAVVADLCETLLGAPVAVDLLEAFDPADLGAAERNRLRLVLASAHLLWHDAFRDPPKNRAGLERFLVQEVATLAAIVPLEALFREEERREELVRRALRALGIALAGESPREAEDRLKQVDSIERRRLVVAAAEHERRARAVREAMARKAAQEAAAKVSRE